MTAEWGRELATAGRVTFPLRRRPLVVQVVLFTYLVVGSTGNIVTSVIQHSWDWWTTLFAVILPVALIVLYSSTRSLITGRPELIVDHTGITLAKEHLDWHEITSIRPTRAPRILTFTAITVVPREKPRLSIPHEYARHAEPLATWLNHLLEQHNRPTSENFMDSPNRPLQ